MYCSKKLISGLSVVFAHKGINEIISAARTWELTSMGSSSNAPITCCTLKKRHATMTKVGSATPRQLERLDNTVISTVIKQECL